MPLRTMDTREPTDLFRIEVEGRLSPSAGQRLGAESVVAAGSRTILDIRVPDQSAMLGRLRQIHDLNLRLISVTRTDSEQ